MGTLKLCCWYWYCGRGFTGSGGGLVGGMDFEEVNSEALNLNKFLLANRTSWGGVGGKQLVFVLEGLVVLEKFPANAGKWAVGTGVNWAGRPLGKMLFEMVVQLDLGVGGVGAVRAD